MHYFPSTYDEIAEALHRKSCEVIRDGGDPAELCCLVGRLQRKALEEHSREIATHGVDLCSFPVTCITFMGVDIDFDDDSPWRFEFA